MENLRTPASTMEVEMGIKVSQYPIEQYKVSENFVDLITILTKDPVVTKTCYHDKIGFRFHEITASINVGLLPAIHYSFLIAVWNADRTGLTITDNRYQIMVLRCPPKTYDKLVKKANLNGDLRQLVLQVALEGEVNYQGMSFEIHPSIKPPYLIDKGLFDALGKEVKEFKQYIPHVVASSIDDVRFKELWSKEGSAIDKSEESRFSSKGYIGQQQTLDEGDKRVPIGNFKEDDFKFEEVPNKVPPQKPVNELAEKANEMTQGDQSGKFFNANQKFSFEDGK